jgi:hypothetical protein
VSDLRDRVNGALDELRDKRTKLRLRAEGDPGSAQTRIRLGTMAGLCAAIIRVQRALDEADDPPVVDTEKRRADQ